MIKLKLLFHYYRSIQSFNLPFSLLAGVAGMVISQNKVVGMINSFSLCLLTGGFGLALFLYEQRHSNQYYFYHNLGLGRVHLIAGAVSINLFLIFLLFLLKLFLFHG